MVYARIACLVVFSLFGAESPVMTVQVGAAQHTQQASILLCYGQASSSTAYLIAQFLRDTGLLMVALQVYDQADAGALIAQALRDDHAAVLFVDASSSAEGVGVAWRLYEPLGNTMLAGKKVVAERGTDVARHVAGSVYEALMGQQSEFFSTIVACKKVMCRGKKMATHLVLIDPFTRETRTVITGNRLLVAPSWMNFNGSDCLVYSELTPRNVRFIGADLQGRRWPILDVDGTCAGVTQDTRTGAIYYCRSGALWSYLFNNGTHTGVHTVLVSSKGECSCPSITADGRVLFNYGAQLKQYDPHTRAVTKISVDGSCVAPAASPVHDKIVFSRRIHRVVQLFLMDGAGRQVKQLTYDEGDKIDPVFSPGGNFVAFTRQRGRENQICVLVLATGGYRALTNPEDNYSYPCWSPVVKSLYSRQNS